MGDFFKNFVAFSEKLDFTGRTNLKSLHYIYLLIINPFSYFRSTFSYCLLCLLPSFFYRQKRLKQQGDHNTEKPTKENSSNGSSVALKTPLQTAEYRRRRSAAAAASAPSDDFVLLPLYRQLKRTALTLPVNS